MTKGIQQKITPHLWFDTEAEKAAKFYTSVFSAKGGSSSGRKNSKIESVSRYGKEGYEVHGMPEGTAMTVEFTLEGQKFLGLNGGPIFKFNPSVSFHVKCKTKDEVDALWAKLSEEGKVLMELGAYPFSERYGWTEDKYGVSWQVIFVGDPPAGGEIKQKITSVIMFVGDVCGKAEEAVNFYTSVFHNTKVQHIQRYGKGEEPDKEGTLKYSAFTLEGQEFGAMDSAHKHNFTFNEAISFLVNCESQEEVDYFWKKLSAVPESEQCGWLKDKFGLSWQIIPKQLGELLSDKDKEKAGRVMNAMLKMKKIDIADLEKARKGE